VSFHNGLRHILRQDPDVIMVGEIRDPETARTAIQASLTGHLVFSTLHTNDAPSAVARLLDLGAERFLVAAALSAVLAQRLIRLIHSDCQGAGCADCDGIGYRGRAALFELMSVSEKIRDLILEGAGASRLRVAAIDDGMRLLAEDGERQVVAGATTREEILRVVGGDLMRDNGVGAMP